jgi:hypothetical protein
MKNNIRLHFGQAIAVEPKAVGKPVDSGNGYYSYSYYLLPYTGTLTTEAGAAVRRHLHNKHYHYPFTSLNCVEVFGSQNENNGLLLVSTTYHHGD